MRGRAARRGCSARRPPREALQGAGAGGARPRGRPAPEASLGDGCPGPAAAPRAAAAAGWVPPWSTSAPPRYRASVPRFGLSPLAGAARREGRWPAGERRVASAAPGPGAGEACWARRVPAAPCPRWARAAASFSSRAAAAAFPRGPLAGRSGLCRLAQPESPLRAAGAPRSGASPRAVAPRGAGAALLGGFLAGVPPGRGLEGVKASGESLVRAGLVRPRWREPSRNKGKGLNVLLV